MRLSAFPLRFSASLRLKNVCPIFTAETRRTQRKRREAVSAQAFTLPAQVAIGFESIRMLKMAQRKRKTSKEWDGFTHPSWDSLASTRKRVIAEVPRQFMSISLPAAMNHRQSPSMNVLGRGPPDEMAMRVTYLPARGLLNLDVGNHEGIVSASATRIPTTNPRSAIGTPASALKECSLNK